VAQFHPLLLPLPPNGITVPFPATRGQQGHRERGASQHGYWK
jgi:hypothetical protein